MEYTHGIQKQIFEKKIKNAKYKSKNKNVNKEWGIKNKKIELKLQ